MQALEPALHERAARFTGVSLGLGVTNVCAWFYLLGDDTGLGLLLVSLLALAQLVTAIVALLAGVRLLRGARPDEPRPAGALTAVIVGALTVIVAPLLWFFGLAIMAFSGGGMS